MRLLTSNPIFFLRLWDFETWVSASIQIWINAVTNMRFLPEPEVNVLRNRVNIRGSKVQNPNSNWVIKYSKRFILIYIIIYINIKYIILILNLFQNTIWTFEPLNLLNLLRNTSGTSILPSNRNIWVFCPDANCRDSA